MNKKSQCPAGEEGKKVIDRMLIHWPRFPVNVERSLRLSILAVSLFYDLCKYETVCLS